LVLNVNPIVAGFALYPVIPSFVLSAITVYETSFRFMVDSEE
jgi:hypothetical protein